MTAAALRAAGRPPRGRVVWPLLLGGLAIELVLAAALASRPLMVAAGIFAVLALVAAVARPDLVILPVLATLPLVPVYAAPRAGYITLEATVLGLWLVAVGIMARSVLIGGARMRVTAIDLTFLLYLLALLVPVMKGLHPRADYITQVFFAIGAYLGMRLYMARHPDAHWLASVFVGLALITVPFIVLEVATGTNPFFSLKFNSAEASVWAVSQDRGGRLRAEAAFGHSIALAMFLATGFLLALMRALHASDFARRWRWAGVAALLLPMIVLTGSRTGWVVVVVGIVLLTISAPLQLTRARLTALIAGGIIALAGLTVLVPSDVPSPAKLVGSSGSEVGRSSMYRERLLNSALQGNTLSAWGSNRSLASAAIGDGNTSIDNQYLLLASEWGLVPLAAFLLIVAAIAASLVRLRRHGASWALPAVTLANFAGLFFVAMITQQEIYIWALVGACSGLMAAARGVRGRDTDN